MKLKAYCKGNMLEKQMKERDRQKCRKREKERDVGRERGSERESIFSMRGM